MMYLPGMRYRGGRMMNMYRGLSSFPVLVKAGAIIPMTEELESIQKNPVKMCLHVYPGGEGGFLLYEDDNETEDYKKGSFVKTPVTLSWNSEEKTAELVIKAPQGNRETSAREEKLESDLPWHRALSDRSGSRAFLGRVSRRTTVRILGSRGESSLGEITYDRKNASLCCDLGEQDPAKEIRILLRDIKEKENDIAACAFDFLNQAEIEFVLKDILYQMIREGEDKTIFIVPASGYGTGSGAAGSADRDHNGVEGNIKRKQDREIQFPSCGLLWVAKYLRTIYELYCRAVCFYPVQCLGHCRDRNDDHGNDPFYKQVAVVVYNGIYTGKCLWKIIRAYSPSSRGNRPGHGRRPLAMTAAM